MSIILFPDGTYAAVAPGIDIAAEASRLGGRVADVSEIPDPIVHADDIAARRYQAEIAGIAWNGYGISTDREGGQAKIDKEDRAVDQGLRAEGSGWKCLDLATGQIVFRPTSNTEIKEIAAAVYHYVAACYAREAELLQALADGTLTDDMLEQGWP